MLCCHKSGFIIIQELIIKILYNQILGYCKISWLHHEKILHMPRQQCCCGMCKILTWCHHKFLQDYKYSRCDVNIEHVHSYCHGPHIQMVHGIFQGYHLPPCLVNNQARGALEIPHTCCKLTPEGSADSQAFNHDSQLCHRAWLSAVSALETIQGAGVMWRHTGWGFKGCLWKITRFAQQKEHKTTRRITKLIRTIKIMMPKCWYSNDRPKFKLKAPEKICNEKIYMENSLQFFKETIIMFMLYTKLSTMDQNLSLHIIQFYLTETETTYNDLIVCFTNFREIILQSSWFIIYWHWFILALYQIGDKPLSKPKMAMFKHINMNSRWACLINQCDSKHWKNDNQLPFIILFPGNNIIWTHNTSIQIS